SFCCFPCSQVLPGNTVFEALPHARIEAEPQAMGSHPETWNQLLPTLQKHKKNRLINTNRI
ncbi:MAG: hypothetical protein SWZ49_25420, partial [Cyanobacteriota bacterium]|nr:hypothetical protein [Cyanobacteriota bacterium]